jgi:dethiobiotin synthetase
VSLFITGTDTGVGKTRTAIELLRMLRTSGASCAGMKPICCGDRKDAELLLAAGSASLTIDDVNPVWLQTPVAPIVGSLIENAQIDIARILSVFHALQNQVEHVIVEGVGGWLVPIRSDYFVSDLAAAMNLPVLVVAPNRLGCLNHTVLTVRSIAEYSLRCLGVALISIPGANDIAAATNQDVLKKILSVPLLDGLGENLMELPVDWRFMVDST